VSRLDLVRDGVGVVRGPARSAAEPDHPTGRINGWKSILNTLAITYGDRLTVN
jgi:hypothetical protein